MNYTHIMKKGNEPSVGTFLSWLSDEKLKNIITDISTDEFINPEYTEEVLQGHLETLRRHQEKLEKDGNHLQDKTNGKKQIL